MTTDSELPLPVDAIQLSWANWNDVHTFLGDAFPAENPQGATALEAGEVSDTCGEPGPQYIALYVRTASGDIAVVRHGDWIVRESMPGRFYPVKAEAWARTCGPATEDSCVKVTIDDENIRVYGQGDLTEAGKEALGALLSVARRKLAAEEPGCSHCGGPHAWDVCQAYADLVHADRSGALVARIDLAIRDTLNGAFGTFLDIPESQLSTLHHILVSSVSTEVHRKIPSGTQQR